MYFLSLPLVSKFMKYESVVFTAEERTHILDGYHALARQLGDSISHNDFERLHKTMAEAAENGFIIATDLGSIPFVEA